MDKIIHIHFTLHQVYSLNETGSVRILELSIEFNDLSSEKIEKNYVHCCIEFWLVVKIERRVLPFSPGLSSPDS